MREAAEPRHRIVSENFSRGDRPNESGPVSLSGLSAEAAGFEPTTSSSPTRARLRRPFSSDRLPTICAGHGVSRCCWLLPVVGQFAACLLLPRDWDRRAARDRWAWRGHVPGSLGVFAEGSGAAARPETWYPHTGQTPLRSRSVSLGEHREGLHEVVQVRPRPQHRSRACCRTAYGIPDLGA